MYLPAANQVHDGTASGGNGDTPWIQTGGHAANGASEIDAGFQHGSTYGDYASFVRVAGVGTKFGARYAEGQTMYFKFYVPSDNQVAFFIQGIKKGESTISSETVVSSAPGWKFSGTGNTIKRTTSISSNGTYTTGSYLKNVLWSNSYIGKSSTDNSQWLASQAGGYCSTPSNMVSVNFVNAGEETVTLSIPS